MMPFFHAAPRFMRLAAGVLGVLCCLGSALPAAAQEARPKLYAKWLFSHDTDDFDEIRTTLGYLYANGFGFGIDAAHYRAPGWSATGSGVSALYLANQEGQRLEGALGVARTNGRDALTGMLDYERRVSEKATVGVSLERNIVDSVESIERGITYNAAMLVADYRFTPRFNVGLAGGAFWFSDDNRRPILRTRWNWELIPDSGINLYLKTRHYRNTRPYLRHYYAPDSLREASLGLSARRALSRSVVFFASADAGRQSVDHEIDNNIWSFRIGLQSRYPRAPLQWRIALEASNNSSNWADGGGEDYRYYSLGGYLLIPLE
ncbi:MAG: hypothetical protein LBL69_06250 [Zoogloeaceae bacterium]|nr:hypothetical protein [Zoogloeaceae bacterium]